MKSEYESQCALEWTKAKITNRIILTEKQPKSNLPGEKQKTNSYLEPVRLKFILNIFRHYKKLCHLIKY